VEIAQTHSYRHAEAIIEKEFAQERAEILTVIQSVEWSLKNPPVTRRRNGKVVANLTINQAATNSAFEAEFRKQDWTVHPLLVSTSESRLVADFKKGSVQVEVQFGNMARWYTDVFKFLLSYAADDIEVGVLIVPMQARANQIDENVVYFERIVRELPHAKMAVTIPVWVIGLT
jgi:hypothetical protein